MPLYDPPDVTSVVTIDVDGFLVIPGQPPQKTMTEDLGSGSLRITRMIKNATGDQIVESVVETSPTS